MKRIIFSLTFILLSLSGRSQLSFHHQHYSVQDGLSENNISVIFQDSRHFIWLGTYNGLNRFDGYSFKHYKTLSTIGDEVMLENDHILRVTEDRAGFLWVITYDGKVYRLDVDTGKFETLRRGPTPDERLPFVTQFFNLANGDIWLTGRSNAVVRIVPGKTLSDFTYDIYGEESGISAGESILAVSQTSQDECVVLTDRSLVRLDRATNSFKKIDCNGTTPHSISGGEHGGKELLAGMGNGMVCKITDKFSCVRLAHPFSSEIVRIDFLDSLNYVAYSNLEGIVTGNVNNGKHNVYKTPPGRRPNPNANPRLFVDSFGDVWINSGKEWVVRFDPRKGTVEHLTVPTYFRDGSSTESEFFETPDGMLFVRMWGNKGCYYDRKTGRLVPIIPEPGDTPFNNNILRWASDNQGNIWLATQQREIEKITVEKRLHLVRLFDDDHLEQNDIHSLMVDRDGRSWLGTREGRICIMDPSGEVTGYLSADGRITPRGDIWPRVYCFAQDMDGEIWFGTRGHGLYNMREDARGRFSVRRYMNDSNISSNHGRGHVFFLHTDAEGRLWITTWGEGVWYMNRDEARRPSFIKLSDVVDTYPASFDRVRHITSDGHGRIWCSSPEGVMSFSVDPETFPGGIEFTTLTSTDTGSRYIPVNNVSATLCTKRGEVFIGTAGGGLCRIIMRGDTVESLQNFNSISGFPSDIIYSLTEDGNGDLWMGTSNGIVRFDCASERFDTFGNDHYLPYNMASNAAVAAPTGNIMFGTNKGLVVFDPDDMAKDTFVPPLYITGLQLFHNDVHPGDESKLLAEPLSKTGRVVFNHRQSVFNIEFAALDFKNPAKIGYSYMLDGFDQGWNNVGTVRSASYNNLPAGDYLFRVRSTNSDGAWVDNEARLEITVLPPFWKTPTAYMLYVLFGLLVIFATAYILAYFYRMKHAIRVDQEVMRVFTNISHEIRTPLTLVHAPVEHILKTKKLDVEIEEELQIVYRNSGRLLQLVNHLLDFRKIQHKRMPVILHRVNITSLSKDTVLNFASLAEQKNITINFNSTCPELEIEIDREKMETIFYNLLSNAVKYTPAGKSIYFTMERLGDALTFRVEDEGVGIAKDRLTKLFTPFEGGDKGPNDIQPGTGIGLALAKEFCNLLDIEMTLESRQGSGTIVTLVLQVGAQWGVPTEEGDDSVELVSVSGETPPTEEEGGEEDDGRKKVLIVEDNVELRRFLKRILSGEYDVIEAGNGKEGLRLAHERLPDLIISDLMMPEMDGTVFAENLKTDINTSHVPVIILTAQSDPKVQAELFKLGVDAFIVKPFNAEILITRVESILKQRERLHAIYSSSLFAITHHKKTDNLTSEKDREFLDRLMDYLGEHLSMSDIAVEDICSVSGFSYSLLYKKLKTLVGLSPLEFIREFQMQKAAELILQGRLSMKEVAYMVGFSDPRYFSRSFKQKYGTTPSEYKNKAGRVDET